MAAAANPKGEFYAAQLELALTHGQWTSSAPAKAYNQVPISWAELFRKHRKHCPAESISAEVASQLHVVSLLLLRSRSLTEDPESDDRSVDGELRFTDECVLSSECKDEAQASYDKLDGLAEKTDSVRSTLGYVSYTLSRPEECLAHLEPFSADDNPSLSPWTLIERIRSLTLKGMASELIRPSDALDYYNAAIQLLPPPAPANPPGELARWAERALWRACILSAQSQPASKVLPVMRTYVAHSSRWPATFRPRHRATVLRLHLHALSLCSPPGPLSQRQGRLAWLHETRTTVAEARAVLTGSTRFPASGSRNTAVEAFVDACVRVWEAGGATSDQADWVIDVSVFNSPPLMRHLSRLLAVSGDVHLSKRVLMLYIKLMRHARETSDKSGPSAPATANGAGHSQPNGKIRPSAPPDDGTDPDPVFLHAVVQGIRMLCRTGDYASASELVPIARGVLDRCHLPQDEMHSAKTAVDLADAIWNLVSGANAHAGETRARHLEAARELLEQLDDPAAKYHLALLRSLYGSAQLTEAVEAAREAVEGTPRELRAWHLLGLLLSAQGDVNAARSILELGGALEEEEVAPPDPENINVLDGWNQFQAGWPGAQEDWAKRDEREDALQLRMSQVALTERVLGAEGASKRWLEVFTWWSHVYPAESVSSSSATPEIPALTLTRTMTPHPEEDENVPPTPIPIQLIPPSPHDESPASGSTPQVDGSPRVMSPTSEKQGDGDKLMAKMREQVTKGRARIDTISKKIGNRRSSSETRRSSSAPDFSLVLSRTSSYQASSIHSRGRLPSPIGSLAIRRRSPSPPPPPPPPPPPSAEKEKAKGREKRERRLRSELWLMSAATFRRQGRLEHARGAIQYAEACDGGNANVYIQLGLYHAAHRDTLRAGQALDKALVLAPGSIQALTHRATLHLEAGDVDLAEGMANGLTSGIGWATPEAWFIRAKAAGRQGRVAEQRQWLEQALVLCEGRGVREVGEALGWCL